MAVSKEFLEEAEFVKTRIMHSNLDEQCKKSLHRLINISTEATNGLTLDEKVQKVTEAICGMVFSQVNFLDTVDKKIENANKEQCKTCAAMKHATDEEHEKQRQEAILEWKKQNGYVDGKNSIPSNMSIFDTLKTVLVRPWAWIFGSILVFSPYGVQIVDSILKFFQK